MNSIFRYVAASFLCIPAIFAAEYFPLDTGNSWTYRSTWNGEPLRIDVGLPVMMGGRTYYTLTGYGTRKYLARIDGNGGLVAIDEDSGKEFPLALFETGRSYQTSAGGCPQNAEVEAKPVAFEGPAGHFEGVRIGYRNTQCADIGFDQEVYVENIGLVRRVITTIAGPRQYDLVSARVGRMSLESSPGGAARLNLERPNLVRRSEAETPTLEAELAVFIDRTNPLELTFGSSLRADLLVRDASGKEVLRWTDGKFFLTVIGKETFDGVRRFPLPVVLKDRTGRPLPDGSYTAEAFLATLSEQPRFHASAAFTLLTSKDGAQPSSPRTASETPVWIPRRVMGRR